MQGQTENKRCRYIFDRAQGCVVEAASWEGPPPPRRAPAVIGDSHEPFKSMADGRVYDSKSRYRAELKARGMVELGNDVPEHRDASTFEPAGVEADIKESFERLEAGQKPEPLPGKPPEQWQD